MLAEFDERGWLELELADATRTHAQWLDHWVIECTASLSIFIDSDIEFLSREWIEDLVTVARTSKAEFICSEILPEGPNFVEPVGGRTVRLAERPAPWMLALDAGRVRELGESFDFVAVAADIPEGLLAFDVGARVFAAGLRRGLKYVVMPTEFQRTFKHYGGLSWRPLGARRGGKVIARRIERRVRNLRAVQDPGAQARA